MWFKVDDNLATHPKVLKAGNAAMGLWVRAGAWCAQHLSDGHVPAEVISLLGTEAQADALVAVGLWVKSPSGFDFHEWAERQPSREDAEKRRAIDRERKAQWRAARAAKRDASRRDKPGTERGTSAGQDAGRTTESALPVPVPVPISTYVDIENVSEVADATRPDVERLLDLLDSELTKNGVSKLPKRNKTNRDAMRLLLDRDGRTEQQVEAAIRWCQSDEFWRGNILSASKLREKYEQLRAQASRGRRGAAVHENIGLAQRFAAEENALKEVGS